jgi:LuxR family maltose regulon positive regulatory protein
MEKANYYYQLSPFNLSGPSTSVALDAWACRVGTTRSGAMEEYIEALTRAIPHTGNVRNGFMYGLDDLARGEVLFFKGDLKAGEKFFRQAQQKAEARDQHEVRNRAIFYLLRIGVAHGDFEKIQELLKELEAQLGMTGYFARYLSYDIVSGWYYSLLGQTKFVANWLKGNFSQGTLPTFQSDFGTLIKAKFYYASKQYHELLSFLENDHKLYSQLFRELDKKVLEAACKYHIKNRDGALIALREAYDLALSNSLIMPFIELGRDMRTLTSAAMREKDNYGIPRQWLETINRKAATYAKRLALVVSEYRKANNLDGENGVTLSGRETDVLNGIWQGLSRAEIAVAHDLSVNTVKMILSSIYTKLGADNVADVIRIALDRGLLQQKKP